MSLKDSTIVPVLAVDDLERAMAFYRDKLGLKAERSPSDPTGAVVELNEHNSLYLYKTSFKRGETTVAAFAVSDTERVVDELRGRGVVFEEYDFPGLKTERGIATQDGLKSAWFKDSEGNTIAISDMSAESVRKAA
jgi:catechol 2,3-dioxygenase-like lactoylglutathione lyase family enzyme